jgi:hypothetical protein
MPRGRPKRRVALRLDHDLVAEVQSLAGPGEFTAVIERLLATWLQQARRKIAAERSQIPQQAAAAPMGQETARHDAQAA